MNEGPIKRTDDAHQDHKIPASDLVKRLEESVAKIMAGGSAAMAAVAADAEALGLGPQYKVLKILVFATKARKLFEEIEGELVIDSAKEIFAELAAAASARRSIAEGAASADLTIRGVWPELLRHSKRTWNDRR